MPLSVEIFFNFILFKTFWETKLKCDTITPKFKYIRPFRSRYGLPAITISVCAFIVGIYGSQGIQHRIISIDSVYEECEMVFIKVNRNDMAKLVGVVYLPKRQN